MKPIEANIVSLQQSLRAGMLVLAAVSSLYSASVPAQSSLALLVFDPVPLASLPAPTEAADTPKPAVDDAPSTGDDAPSTAPIDLRDYLSERAASDVDSLPISLDLEIRRYEQSLTALESTGGPYAAGLGEELLSLGALYRRIGDLPKALESFERASHVNRVNEGLFGPGQIPIIEQQIATHLAQGDIVAADQQQEYLFYLHRKIAGNRSVDLLPALKRYAEWNVFAFNPGLLVVSSPGRDGEGNALSTEVQPDLRGLEEFRARRLINAQSIYQSIIQILLSNYGLTDPSLLDFEKQLAITNYFFATKYEAAPREISPTALGSMTTMQSDFSLAAPSALGYRQGRDALERRVDYMRAMQDISPVDLARARLDLADWQLRFRKRNDALGLYRETLKELRASDIPGSDISTLFHPEVPQQIPTFLIHPYTRENLDIPADVPLVYKGHIDVEFGVNRYGTTGGITVLGKSAETPPQIESQLVRRLRFAQFRPHFTEDGVAGDGLYRLRYYYTY